MTSALRTGWLRVTVLSAAGILTWATSTWADPIRIGVATNYPTGFPSAGSINDTDGDGVADSGSYYMAVGNAGSGFQERGFAEFDVSGLSASSIQQAWFNAPVESGFREPERQIQASLYAGNGQFDLSDYAIDAELLGMVTIPAGESSGVLQIDLTAALDRLLASGASYAGIRFDPVGLMDPVLIGGHAGESAFLDVDTTLSSTPEPASLVLLSTGAGLLALRRRRTVVD